MFVKRMREEEDRLSQLPDSVAFHILSFLSMKDAARTSALSKIWRGLWLHADFFNFDAYGVFKRPDAKYFTIPENVTKYVEWVSNVLRSHRESTDYEGKPLVLRKLRIHMCLIQQFQTELEEWLSYAFTRGVQSLELDFTVCCLPRCVFSGRFPDGTDFNSLRSLSLSHVDVTGEVINSLLCNFPFLERLKVYHSLTLESLTVCGSSLALKHLDISFCISLRHLTVRDTSLVTLAIHCVAELVLFNNPKLVVLRASEWKYPKLEQLSDCLSTVQNFAFDATYSDHLEDINKVPRLREVKQLTLIVDPLLEDSLIRLAALLSLSPKLEKLVLQFEYVRRSYPKKKMVLSTVSRRFPVQQRVKVVEVCGYYGDVAENEALMYVLHHAMVPPGRVIFDPHNLHRDLHAPISYFRVEDAIRTSAKKRAELLKTVLPSSVVFSVI